MQSPLVYDDDYYELRKSQTLSLRRYCLLRNSILTNNARNAASQAGQRLILSERCSANTHDALFLLLSNWIRDDLNIEREKFPGQL